MNKALKTAALSCSSLALCAGASAQFTASNVAAQPVNNAMTFSEVARGLDNLQFALDVECDCTWENGSWDGFDGQSSETGTSVEDSRAADDFCLKEGYVYEITEISVQMLSDTEEPDATLQLYHDCNGCPSDYVDCGFFDEPSITGQEDLGGGWYLYTFTFDTTARTRVDEYGEEVEYPALWLKGGCYWVSPVGIGDGTGYDRYFWGTAGDNLLGAVPKAQAGPFKIDGWERVDNLNVACRNFAFEVCANECCIIRDNGEPSLDVTWSVDTTLPGCYNADNVVITPCEDTDLCFFSAYIYTNCECERTKLRIFADDCGEIGEEITSDYVLVTKCVPLSGAGSANGGVDFEGQQLTKYRVEFHDLSEVPTLAGGDNYWIALEVQGSGSFNERGFWAFNENCEDSECTIHISSGQAICPAGGLLDWEALDHDYAFCLAGVPAGGSDTGSTASTGCAADYNGDGERTVADLLSFLDVWFEGCEN